MPALTDQRLAEAAFLYYVEDLSQADVAERLGTSRSNVSRMITAARDRNIVRFEILYPSIRDKVRERAVMEAFTGTALREVVVTGSGDRNDPDMVGSLLSVCRATSEWLPSVLDDGLTLGLSWGGTVQAFVDSVVLKGRWDVQVLQLTGEASLDSRHSGQDLVRDLAERLGGTHWYFNAPGVVPTEDAARSLSQGPVVAAALDRARSADVALMGVGQFNVGTSRTFLADVAQATAAEIEEADAKGVVGQICGRFFDRNGQQVDIALSKRVLSVDLEDLRKIPVAAVLAVGPEKAVAVRGAVLGGFVHTLVIDANLADAVLGAVLEAPA